jgi:hypothetical protein
MSSMKNMINFSISGMNTMFMRYIKCFSTFVNPNDKTLIKTVSSGECCLEDIFRLNLDLMIFGVEINLVEHLGSC